MELFNCQTTDSRLIVKPDEEWARIMDEVDSLSEENRVKILSVDKEIKRE